MVPLIDIENIVEVELSSSQLDSQVWSSGLEIA